MLNKYLREAYICKNKNPNSIKNLDDVITINNYFT